MMASISSAVSNGKNVFDKPLSIQEITKQAKDYYFDPQVSLKIYFRSADHILQQASIYEREGNHQETYRLLFKYTTLILEDLPRHPQASLPEYSAPMTKARRAAPLCLAKLERLKPKITERYDRYQKILRDRHGRSSLSGASGAGTGAGEGTGARQSRVSFVDERAKGRQMSIDEVIVDGARAVPAEGNQDLAASLARQEIRRRRQEKMAAPEQQREGAEGPPWEGRLDGRGVVEYSGAEAGEAADQKDVSDGSLQAGIEFGDQDDIRQRMMETRRRIDSAKQPSHRPHPPTSNGSQHSILPSRSASLMQDDMRQKLSLSTTSLSSSRRSSVRSSPISPTHIASQLLYTGERNQRKYNYPPIPRRSDTPPSTNPSTSTPNLAAVSSTSRLAYPPERPPKDTFTSLQPRRPSKTAIDQSRSVPSLRRSSTAENARPTITFKPSAFLESGVPLRTIFLPSSLRAEFLTLAGPNTRQNVETCGILCGTLISNALFISKLVIPEQESTSDTCETINEEALFDYCESEDLMVLGWIHTHPSQTCFMSSRDLHTHAAYQAMLPESIAIVCAPSKQPSSGIFRLTDPPGKQVVLECHQTGLFHPHSESNIYTDALKPGHVVESPGFAFDTVDLRPNSRF